MGGIRIIPHRVSERRVREERGFVRGEDVIGNVDANREDVAEGYGVGMGYREGDAVSGGGADGVGEVTVLGEGGGGLYETEDGIVGDGDGSLWWDVEVLEEFLMVCVTVWLLGYVFKVVVVIGDDGGGGGGEKGGIVSVLVPGSDRFFGRWYYFRRHSPVLPDI